jgi:hypothetical protein
MTAVQSEAARIGILGPAELRFSEVVSGLKQGLREQGYAEQAIEILEGRVVRGHTCPLKPRSSIIVILPPLTLGRPHALLALRKGIGSTRHEGAYRREGP